MKIQHGYRDNVKILRKCYLFLLMLIVIAVLHREGDATVSEVASFSRSEYGLPIADGELEDIYEEFSRLLPDGIFDGEGEVGIGGIVEVYDYIRGAVSESGGAFLGDLALFMGVVLIFAVAELLGAEQGELADTVKVGACICLAVPILSSAMEKVTAVSEGMLSGCEFFSGIIPLLCSVCAIGGGTGTAAASGASMSITLSLVSRLLASNLLPLATFIFSASLISSFDTGRGTQRILKSAKNLFTFVMGAATVVLLATVGLQSVITSAKDTLAIRSAKYAISGMIPAVGGTISATLSTLITGASVMMSTMGAASVAALAVTMGTPLVSLLIYRFAIQLCISFCGLVGAGFAERFLESLRSSLDCILGVLCSSLIIFILEVVVFMKTGVPVR